MAVALLVAGCLLSVAGLVLADFSQQDSDLRIFIYMAPGIAAIIMAGIVASFGG